MSENLQLPTQAPQGIEHEKWKAMVDSVVDFISASRAMLHLLNDKIAYSEQWNEDQRKKIEEEKTMAAFYKDYLSLAIVPKLDRISATTGPSVDEDTEVDELKRSIDTKKAMKSILKYEDKTCKDCKKLKELAIAEDKDDSAIMTSFRNKLFSTKEIGSNVQHKSEESQYVVENKSINVQTCSKKENMFIDLECTEQCSKHENNNVPSVISKETVILPRPKETLHQQSANSLKKNPSKISRIPRAQSFNDREHKNSLVERTPHEGPRFGKYLCRKKNEKEATYQDLHQKCKSKTPKGDGALQI